MLDESVGPTQVPMVFIATLVLQEALVRIIDFMESMAQTGVLPMALATCQAEGGAQTPTTHTPEQIMQGY